MSREEQEKPRLRLLDGNGKFLPDGARPVYLTFNMGNKTMKILDCGYREKAK